MTLLISCVFWGSSDLVDVWLVSVAIIFTTYRLSRVGPDSWCMISCIYCTLFSIKSRKQVTTSGACLLKYALASIRQASSTAQQSRICSADHSWTCRCKLAEEDFIVSFWVSLKSCLQWDLIKSDVYLITLEIFDFASSLASTLHLSSQ